MTMNPYATEFQELSHSWKIGKVVNCQWITRIFISDLIESGGLHDLWAYKCDGMDSCGSVIYCMK
jgi:hypothetical protein